MPCRSLTMSQPLLWSWATPAFAQRVGLMCRYEPGDRVNTRRGPGMSPGTVGKHAVSASKVEVKLKKRAPGKWEELEGSGEAEVQAMNAVAAPSASSSSSVADEALKPASKKVYSGSSKDWCVLPGHLPQGSATRP